MTIVLSRGVLAWSAVVQVDRDTHAEEVSVAGMRYRDLAAGVYFLRTHGENSVEPVRLVVLDREKRIEATGQVWIAMGLERPDEMAGCRVARR